MTRDSTLRVLGVGMHAPCKGWLGPSGVHLWYNSSDRNLDRDGPVWQGKGLTASLTAGVAATFGNLSIVLQPIAVFSENRAFSPTNLISAPSDFRDPFWGSTIDIPYRFGDDPYEKLEPGESIIELRTRRFGLGATTRSQHWGPAHFYPLVIGTEGLGYPRIFFEGRGMPLRILDATAHWQVGFLEASPYSGLLPGSRSRISSALIGSIRPKAFPFLELGGTRFFHVRRDSGTLSWRIATLPFTGILKQSTTDTEVGGFNQLGSVFFRAAIPRVGAELYGEFYREDHNVNIRDLAAEPDHISAYSVGFRKTFTDHATTAFTLEHTNGRWSHLQRVRAQSPIYTHSPLTEGHTHRGQPLGSLALLGGTGTVIAWSRILSNRSTDVLVEIVSSAQNQEGGRWENKHAGRYRVRMARTGLWGTHIYTVFGQIITGYLAEQGQQNVSLGLGLVH